MKVHLLKENLAKAAGLAARFQTNKAQLPVLSQVGIEALKDGVYFWATNLEMGIRVRVGGKVLETGEVAVPAKVMAELSNSLPLGAVELTATAGTMVVKAGAVEATIQGMGMSDFPKFGETEGEMDLGKVPLEQLKLAMDRIGFAVSTDESRPVLTGMLWELKRGALVATDGYRLSVVEKALPKIKSDGPERIVVSGGLTHEMVRAFEELGEKEVGFRFNKEKQQVLVSGNDVLLMGRVLGGDFPDYRAILPGESEVVVGCDREELQKALRTVTIFARESANIVKFNFEGERGTLSANAPQVGSNKIDLTVEQKKTGSGTIAFNGKFVSDFLSHAQSERVSMGMSGALKPGLWMEEGNEDYRHVIMPVRVREGEE